MLFAGGFPAWHRRRETDSTILTISVQGFIRVKGSDAVQYWFTVSLGYSRSSQGTVLQSSFNPDHFRPQLVSRHFRELKEHA
jgi:hypothetical protein